jgi:hypothetical protein
MIAAGVAAVLALVIGAAVGRSIIPSPDEQRERVKPVRFTDPQAGISLSYPAGWRPLETTDPEVRLLVAAGPSASLSLRVSDTKIDEVTQDSLPVVKSLTDELLGADQRARQLSPAAAVVVGGLPGYRYRYTYTGTDGTIGAHVHFFFFKPRKLIQLVFQTVPATQLESVEPTFERIAGTLSSTS